MLVVGGSSGIGLATARLCMEEGAGVLIASRNAARLDTAVAELGKDARRQSLDSRDAPAVDRLFAEEEPFDHVIVSAAELAMGSVRDLPLPDAYEAMSSKFWGAYHVARRARIRGAGSITLVSGAAARRPNPKAPLVGAINAALDGLAAGLAMELAPVRVNAVSPGRIDSPFWDFLGESERQALKARAAAALPVGIVGQPEHVARQILACMANPYMTGSVVIVDGGYTAS